MNGTAERAQLAAQDEVTRRYDRNARFYDLWDKPMDLMGVKNRRTHLLQMLEAKPSKSGSVPDGTSTSTPTGWNSPASTCRSTCWREPGGRPSGWPWT